MPHLMFDILLKSLKIKSIYTSISYKSSKHKMNKLETHSRKSQRRALIHSYPFQLHAFFKF